MKIGTIAVMLAAWGAAQSGSASSTLAQTVPAETVPAETAPIQTAPVQKATNGFDEAVKIGLILDNSGPYADVAGAGSEMAARMAVEDFGGTVLGRPIEIVVADPHNSADAAADIARDWFDHQHVAAIMDVAGSSPALAVQAIGRNRDKIVSLNAAGADRLTGEACSPTAVHYAFDTYAIAHTLGKALVERGGDSWFFLTVDYSFGFDLEKDTAAVVRANGGTVLGQALHPLDTTDFTSYLLQAQQSHAKVIGIANAGADSIKTVEQAVHLGLHPGGQTLAALDFLIPDVAAVGLDKAQGMMLSEGFYWDLNDATRAWSKRYFERMHKMPDSLQAGVYSSTMHYLKAIAGAGTVATQPVMAAMRATPIDDFFAKDGHIRADGLMVHDMYLFQVKAPSESHYPWDYYKLVATVPADRAFEPLAESKCPLVNRPG